MEPPTIFTTTNTVPLHQHSISNYKMRYFPQELVDTVIDKLTELDTPISRYSTVSSRWVYRTQARHFKLVTFKKKASLKKWSKTFKPDPSGASRHVRQIRWISIRTWAGFEAHLHAFTKIEETQFYRCKAFRSLSRIQPLMSLGSSLVRSKIHKTDTSPLVMASLLSYFPRLRRLLVQNFRSKLTLLR